MHRSAQDLLDQAKQVLYGNLKIGYSRWAKTEYKYICPSKDHYSHQWFWDSCFHAIVLSNFDTELAKNELRNLLKVQRHDGFIPHVIFWNPPIFSLHGVGLESRFSLWPKTTELIQPPLIAEAVQIVYERSRDKNFLVEMLPKLVAYYRWLAEHRDPDHDGLISIIAPYESGMDQSPSYDQICKVNNKNRLNVAIACRRVTFKHMLRNYNLNKIFEDDYFNVEDVFVNSVYARNLKILATLLDRQDKEDEAREFFLLAQKVTDSLVKNCFDSDTSFFYDLSGSAETKLYSKTIKGLMPLLLDIDKALAKKLVEKHLLNEKEFLLPYPVPSVAADDPDFKAAPKMILGEPIIWRGPTWINTNWYLIKALAEHGYQAHAEKLKKVTIELVAKEGFREFFDPFSGAGYGTRNFGWSTLVVDLLN